MTLKASAKLSKPSFFKPSKSYFERYRPARISFSLVPIFTWPDLEVSHEDKSMLSFAVVLRGVHAVCRPGGRSGKPCHTQRHGSGSLGPRDAGSGRRNRQQPNRRCV